MKRLLTVILILLTLSANAAHIKGGFFSYKYLGPGSNGNLQYRITLTVYLICNPSDAQLSPPVNFSFFNAGTNQFLQDVLITNISRYDLSKDFDEPCITGDQRKCYYTIIVYDLPIIELPATPNGYTIAYQRCCRIAGINNISGSGSVGNTFSINIPGTAVGQNAETNSSPVFLVNDTAVVCASSFFQYSFKATDSDLVDSLSYEFCNAIQGADQTTSAPATASTPPYSSVPYVAPYSGSQPLGSGVTIDPRTGLISGIAPGSPGQYIVSVCVSEWRQGVLIAKTRKELHVEVGDCNPLKAKWDPKPAFCGIDGVVNFKNDVTNPPGTDFLWVFGDPASGSADTSILETPSHTYPGAGIYTVKLKVSLAGLCADSVTFQVKVFPGFFPGFKFTGSCFSNPYQFNDTTKTNFGVVDTWKWNFGDLSSTTDVSTLKNPQWTYPTPGQRNVSLIVTSNFGCIDTVETLIDVLDKPMITLAFKDTLICRPDAVQLNASGVGTFSWTPLTNIVGANSPTPTVNPTTSTWYVANLNDNGCVNKDSVHVRVVSFVTLQAIADTTICQGDAIQLNAISDGLQFNWTSTPVATISDPTIINPVAISSNTTRYFINAKIGSCNATDFVDVKSVPYPGADAGIAPTICFNTSAQLNASIVGIRFDWSPTNYLNNPTILNPISSPPRTTQYVLSVYDTLGCPKPGRDTVIVTVLPRVRAFAGRDTTVVINQPLQFNGTGGVSYLWSPSIGLTRNDIFNPIGKYDGSFESIKYKLVVKDAAGCADSAFVTVKVFKTNPYVFVPTAFTPNGDGLNEDVKPIAVGISKINYFSVYNRWGQLVFTTTINGKGWDGRINGVLQNSGVFVWMVNAIDYTGKPIFLKGTVALIR